MEAAQGRSWDTNTCFYGSIVLSYYFTLGSQLLFVGLLLRSFHHEAKSHGVAREIGATYQQCSRQAHCKRTGGRHRGCSKLNLLLLQPTTGVVDAWAVKHTILGTGTEWKWREPRTASLRW